MLDRFVYDLEKGFTPIFLICVSSVYGVLNLKAMEEMCPDAFNVSMSVQHMYGIFSLLAPLIFPSVNLFTFLSVDKSNHDPSIRV